MERRTRYRRDDEFDEPPPVIYSMGGRRPHRPRSGSEFYESKKVIYVDTDGNHLIPNGVPLVRASSVSGGRPPQIIIENNHMEENEHRHSRVYLDEEYPRRARRRSRHSRTPSPRYYYESEEDEREDRRRLRELEKMEEDRKREKEMKDKILLEEAKQKAEADERKKEDDKLKEKTIEEYKAEQAKKDREKAEAEKEFRERMRNSLAASGVPEYQIEKIIRKELKIGPSETTTTISTEIAELKRPTYIRVRRKHLDPETLNIYKLPWGYDEDDEEFIVIKQWVPESLQETLFEHTRKIRERRRIAYPASELKKDRDQLLLVKKKEPKKKSPTRNWLFS